MRGKVSKRDVVAIVLVTERWSLFGSLMTFGLMLAILGNAAEPLFNRTAASWYPESVTAVGTVMMTVLPAALLPAQSILRRALRRWSPSRLQDATDVKERCLGWPQRAGG